MPPILTTQRFHGNRMANRSAIRSLSPEAELLVRCSRPDSPGPLAKPLDGDALQDLDWTRVLELGRQHNVLPLLFRYFRTLAPQTVPDAIRHKLRADSMEITKHSLLLTSEFLRIAQRLEDSGIPALCIKGPVLAEQLYGKVSLRAFADLDLLIRPDGLSHAVELLKEMGFSSRWGLNASQMAASLDMHGEVSFADKKRGVQIDLHTALLPSYLMPKGFSERMWSRCREKPFKGRKIRTLSDEDQLLYLCVHGAKHGWSQLKWIADVAWSLALAPDLDWATVLKEAGRTETTRILGSGSDLVHTLYQIPLPLPLRKRIEEEPAISQDARKLLEGLFAPAPSDDSLLPSIPPVWEAVKTTSPENRRRFLRMLLRPTPLEWTAWKLPSGLGFLYPALRVSRLSAKYGSRLARKLTGRLAHLIRLRRDPPPK